MSSADRDALNAALTGVDPAALRRAAADAPRHREALAALADAVEAGDIDAIGAVSEQLAGKGLLDATLRSTLGELGWSFDRLRRELAGLDARSRALMTQQRRLLDLLDDLDARAAGTPALVAALASARAALEDLGPHEAFAAAHDAARHLVDDLGAVVQHPAGPAAAALPRHGARLEAALRMARDAAQTLPTTLLDAIADAAAIAARLDHPLATPLVEIEAQLAEALLGAADPGVDRRWRRALDRALAAGDLSLARRAARRVQAAALTRDDHRLVAVVAHRLAELAQCTGAPEVEVIARLEQALALARVERFADDARRIAADAVVGAEALAARGGADAGDGVSRGGALLARARLMYGQLLDHLGDGAEARRVLRRLMREARDGDPTVLARAALVLGRLEQAHGQPAQAAKNLGYAFDVARERRDAALLDAATPALIEAALARGDEAAALDAFSAARPLYAAVDRDGAFVEAIEARVGEAQVAAWLRPSGA